jgi:hypothetical protein
MSYTQYMFVFIIFICLLFHSRIAIFFNTYNEKLTELTTKKIAAYRLYKKCESDTSLKADLEHFSNVCDPNTRYEVIYNQNTHMQAWTYTNKEDPELFFYAICILICFVFIAILELLFYTVKNYFNNMQYKTSTYCNYL